MKIVTLSRIKGAMLRVEFDTGESVDLDRDTAIQYGFCENREVSTKELEKIAKASALARAKSRALWHLSRGDCSQKAMLQKLTRAGFEHEICNDVVQTLVRLGLINDQAFAERLAQNLAQKNYSSRQIQAKLYDKQIPAEIVKQVVLDTPVDATASIKALIEKKYAQKMKDPAKRQTVFAALARRGFNLSDIKKAMRDFEDEFFYED